MTELTGASKSMARVPYSPARAVVPAGRLGRHGHADRDEPPPCGLAQALPAQTQGVAADRAGRLVGQVGAVHVADGHLPAVLGDAQGVRAGVGDEGQVGGGVPDAFERGGRRGDQVVPHAERSDGRLPRQQQGQLRPGHVSRRQFRDAVARGRGHPAQVVVEVLRRRTEQVAVIGPGDAEQGSGVDTESGEGGGRRPLVRMRNHRA
ncbi:hypothetical protein V3664_32185 [Streptomyces sp. CS62]